MDPLSEELFQLSPYNYGENNPIRFIDPDGQLSTDVVENEDGTYTVVGGDPNDGDNNIYVVEETKKDEKTKKGYKRTGEVIGESLTSHSFFDDNDQAVKGAVIDLKSNKGQDFINKDILAKDPSLTQYALNARNGEPLDFKDRGIKEALKKGITRNQHRYRGSVASNGKIASARDFGNQAAGIVAGRKGLSWETTRSFFDGYQSYKSGRNTTEGQTSQKAQKSGYAIGRAIRFKEGRMTSRGYKKY